MKAYSQDLRERVLSAVERGEPIASVAGRLEVSERWVYRVKSRYEKTGHRSAFKMGGHRRSRLADMREEICSWIEAQPDLTLAEIVKRLADEYTIEITISPLWYQLRKWGLSFKKKSLRPRANSSGCSSPA